MRAGQTGPEATSSPNASCVCGGDKPAPATVFGLMSGLSPSVKFKRRAESDVTETKAGHSGRWGWTLQTEGPRVWSLMAGGTGDTEGRS